MKKTRTLYLDAVIWVVIMILAATAAFFMLKRDAQRSFGAISFGAMPKFHTKTIEGKMFDDHMMKGKIWAVHQGGVSQATELSQMSQRTESGKRKLFVLTLLRNGDPIFKPRDASHYIVNPQGILDSSGFVENLKEGKVLLVDQNGIIRGKYDLHDPDSLRSFRADFQRIL